ncbi:MAG: hypothetical protein JNK48_19050 [Bryobacterales bacterium]|nr:hypothetical protein [Bryobacterales bacterium]
MPEAIIERAVAHAQKVFDKADIPAKLKICPHPKDSTPEQKCPIVEHAFLLGIVGENRDLIVQRDTYTIGYTLRTTGRNNAAVIWPRVQSYAQYLGINVDLLLGYAMAHEIGHLLSPIGHHSIGVMDAAWDRDDAIDMARGRMGICDRDADHMRRHVERMASAGGAFPHTNEDRSAMQPRATY